MAWIKQRGFNNVGEGGNADGVCEAAVCLWMKSTAIRFTRFNMSNSAADNLPSNQSANALYEEFDCGYNYTFRSLSYLSDQILPGVRGRKKYRDQQIGADLGFEYCHFSHRKEKMEVFNWQEFIEKIMVHGDAVFLQLTKSAGGVGHAVGLYKEGPYFWVFDPNSGLYRGTLDNQFLNLPDSRAAANYLSGLTKRWDEMTCYGIHLSV